MDLPGKVFRLISLFWLFGFTFVSPLAADTVAVLLSDQKGSYAEFAEALRTQLARIAPPVTVTLTQSVDVATAVGVRVVVAVGTAAQQALAETAGRPGRPSSLAVLTTRATYERTMDKAARATSALYLDQPEERQLALLKMLPGDIQGVGVISSPASASLVARLSHAAGRLRLKLVEVPVTTERGVARAVQEAAAQSEVLLAHPDPAVFNPQTIQNILLTTYRARVPVLGFSPAYTRAGALLSLHSSVPQLAEQAADMVRQLLAGQVPGPQYPKNFEVSINTQVARSLGIELPTEQVLLQGLRQRESRP